MCSCFAFAQVVGKFLLSQNGQVMYKPIKTRCLHSACLLKPKALSLLLLAFKLECNKSMLHHIPKAIHLQLLHWQQCEIFAAETEAACSSY